MNESIDALSKGFVTGACIVLVFIAVGIAEDISSIKDDLHDAVRTLHLEERR